MHTVSNLYPLNQGDFTAFLSLLCPYICQEWRCIDTKGPSIYLKILCIVEKAKMVSNGTHFEKSKKQFECKKLLVLGYI